jgi:hypothetical protein
MPNYHKRKRRKWHVLKKVIIGLLKVLENHLEEEDQEKVQKFVHFLDHLYE